MRTCEMCVHTNDKKYTTHRDVPETEFSSLSIEHNTVRNLDALNNKVWDENETIYWQLDSEYEWLNDSQLEDLIKLAFLEPSLLTKLKIQQKRKQTGDAHIRINWLGKKDEKYFTSESILAFAYGPGKGLGGDVTMNADNIWWLNDDPLTVQDAYNLGMIDTFDRNHPDNILKTYDPVHTMKHEGGHALGMRHIDNATFAKSAIMYPYYNGLRKFGDPDIEYLFSLYTEMSFWERVRRIIDIKMRRF